MGKPTWPENSLNEGQGISPGDTRNTGALARARPRRAPRSTKARASAPATPGTVQLLVRRIRTNAQRRPGHQPRRHSRRVPPVPLVGKRVCAQRRPGHQPRRHAEAGSAVAGCVKTAQRRPGHQPRRHFSRSYRGAWCAAFDRSTKARASAPATPLGLQKDGGETLIRRTLNEGQGISPGDTCAAVDVSACRRDVDRSTKARASAPATLATSWIYRSSCCYGALNEGQGISPGDTVREIGGHRFPLSMPALNEGQGISPGDTRQR